MKKWYVVFSCICVLLLYVFFIDGIVPPFVFLDVGQGDASLFTFEDGTQALVDCGIDATVLEGLGRHMPFYDKYIDYVIVTHLDLDHYGGCIDVLHRFDVGTFVYNGTQSDSAMWQVLLHTLEEKDVEMYIIEEYQTWSFLEESIIFLYPNYSLRQDASLFEGKNNESIVMKFFVSGTNILITGDAEEELEEYLAFQYGSELASDILHIGHHGSQTSSIVSFLKAVSPHIGVISVGKKNSYGHPSSRVLWRLSQLGIAVFETSEIGDILSLY
ncbi:MAG: MBL fold metallo-hydrolase [Candidatus Magasanikbacteria bacterium]|jgi:competence protein ComEC|nr:MBL fold metallo-hydrolase [Candidatus Magasanikbacteria bacterium]MBT4221456.1 MBL fold metallo-hydrolase [Candidatus Magasanikbacteria bacterium]MBT4350696.1 MBL fold metallo-hydrolase [Candidatus Magasanikbacteria bacterium]MBT4541628.1 MBL fold metallo-hydrolase [Candidatus Magasanikbacteria bacterium]MBT6252929.1 MBL fold metallo-hydrolase [Candidatus Magasanikbacteria bacterium]